MRRLLEKPEYVVLALLSLLCVVALSLPGPERFGLARRVNRAFLLPVLLVKDDIEGYVGLRGENARLREDLERTALELSELRWTRVENLKLREALSFRERLPVQIVAAEIIASSGERLPRSFVIDKGSKDGIRPNLPVVTPEGLVGKTAETDRGSALVLTLRHPDFRASAIALAGDQVEAGIAAASAAGELELIVPLRSSARPGDPVITSGIGPVYPRGIAIGRISKITEEDRLKLQKNDRIVPGVDLQRVTSVFVLTQLPEEGLGERAEGARRSGGGDEAVGADESAGLFWPGYEAATRLAGDSVGSDSLAAVTAPPGAP